MRQAPHAAPRPRHAPVRSTTSRSGRLTCRAPSGGPAARSCGGRSWRWARRCSPGVPPTPGRVGAAGRSSGSWACSSGSVPPGRIRSIDGADRSSSQRSSSATARATWSRAGRARCSSMPAACPTATRDRGASFLRLRRWASARSMRWSSRTARVPACRRFPRCCVRSRSVDSWCRPSWPTTSATARVRGRCSPRGSRRTDSGPTSHAWGTA